MLPRRNRLRAEADIQHVFRKGRRRHGALMTVHIQPATENRSTVIVGKKISKKAVVRNRLKRRIRDVIRRNQPARAVDMIVVPKPAAQDASITEIEQEFQEILQQLLSKPRNDRHRTYQSPQKHRAIRD